MTENVLPQPDGRPSETPVDRHPIVVAAVESLRAFGAHLDRENATMILPMWAHFFELSAREVAAVLACFPVEAPPAAPTTTSGRRPLPARDDITPADCEGSTWDPDASVPLPGGGWISGPSIGGEQ